MTTIADKTMMASFDQADREFDRNGQKVLEYVRHWDNGDGKGFIKLIWVAGSMNELTRKQKKESGVVYSCMNPIFHIDLGKDATEADLDVARESVAKLFDDYWSKPQTLIRFNAVDEDIHDRIKIDPLRVVDDKDVL